MNKEEFSTKMSELMEEWPDDDLAELHNACVQDVGGTRIYSVWDADQFFFPKNKKDDDYFFSVTESGMPQSFRDLTSPESPFDAEKLIEILYAQKKSYGFEEIQALLEQVD